MVTAPGLQKRSKLIRTCPIGLHSAYSADNIALNGLYLRLGFALTSQNLHTRLRFRNEFRGLPRIGPGAFSVEGPPQGGLSVFYGVRVCPAQMAFTVEAFALAWNYAEFRNLASSLASGLES